MRQAPASGYLSAAAKAAIVILYGDVRAAEGARAAAQTAEAGSAEWFSDSAVDSLIPSNQFLFMLAGNFPSEGSSFGV